MKILDAFGPNPRTVRMFLLEKGITLPSSYVDTLGGENRQSAYLEKNPTGQVPLLETSDGVYIAETVAICEYLEEIHPDVPLIGSNAEERAVTRSAVRRVELRVTEFVYNFLKFGPMIGFFQDRTLCFPDAAQPMRDKAREGLELIEAMLNGKHYIANDRFSLADIILFTCLDFTSSVGQVIDAELPNLDAWKTRVADRKSAEESLSKNWSDIGFRG